MNPIQVDLVVLGLQEYDDLSFLENKVEFASQNETYQFELDYYGNNYGINFQKLANLLKNHILINLNLPKNKYSYYIYNNEKEKFIYINTSKLRQRNNFYPITLEHILDENKIAIKVQYQIRYSEYEENCMNLNKIDKAIDNIKFQSLTLERELENQKYCLNKIIHIQKDIAKKNSILLGEPEKIDIALLYSHPLINDKKYKPVSYKEEFERLKDIKHRANKKINYLITQATLNNLKYVLQADPQIIHLSLHGKFENDIQSSFLEFENQYQIHNAYTYQLNQIIQNHKSNLKLIFLNSCCSNEIAKKISSFSTTIAVDQLEKIDDQIAEEFSQEFYKNLELQEKTIKESFDQAKDTLLKKYEYNDKIHTIKDMFNFSKNQKELKKFKINPKKGKVYINFEPGKAQDLRRINLHQKEEFKNQEIQIPILYRGLEKQLNSFLNNQDKLILLIILKNQEKIQELKEQKLVDNAYQYFIQREPPIYCAAANEYQFPQKIKRINISDIEQFSEQFSSICIFEVTSQSFEEKHNKIAQIAQKNICIIITSEEITKNYDKIRFFTIRLDL